MGFFVAMACSISLTQGLLALLCVLALLVPAGSAWTPGRIRDAGRSTPRLPARGETSASLRRHPLTPPFLTFAGLDAPVRGVLGQPGMELLDRAGPASDRDLLPGPPVHAGHSPRDRLWQAFLAALSLMAAYGLGQAYLCGSRPTFMPTAWLSEICTHAQRVRGPFSIYMTFGGVLFLGVLFFLAYLANVPWRRAWWMLPGAVVTAAALAFTYSRNAWLGLAAGALGLVLTAQRTLRIVAVLAAVLALGAVALPGPVAERARSVVNLEDQYPARPGGDVAVGSLHGRRPSPARRRPWRGPDLVPALPAPRGGPAEHRPSPQLRDPDRRGARAPRPDRLGVALGRLLPRGVADPGPSRAGIPDAARSGLRESGGRRWDSWWRACSSTTSATPRSRRWSSR